MEGLSGAVQSFLPNNSVMEMVVNNVLVNLVERYHKQGKRLELREAEPGCAYREPYPALFVNGRELHRFGSWSSAKSVCQMLTTDIKGLKIYVSEAADEQMA